MSIKLYSSSVLYIVPLLIIIIFSFFLSGTFEYSGKGIIAPHDTESTTGLNTPTTFPQTASISLLPATIAVSGGSGSVTVSLNAGDVEVNAVSLEIEYDVDKLTNVQITEDNYFTGQQVLTKTVADGKIMLSLLSGLAVPLPTGTKTVATITFSRITTASSPTTVSFSANTAAYGKGSSGTNIIGSLKNPATITW